MSKIKTPKLQVRAEVQENSFDKEKRTIEVVFSTGAKGIRYSWDGAYMEELSMKKDHVRLERLNKGAPVLNNHQSWDLRSSIGVVDKAWVKGNIGYATLRLSGREEVAGIVQDIKDGIIRNVSVGYIVHKYEDVTKKNDEVKTYRAVDWEPMEISFVNMPFDKDAQSRALEKKDEMFETELTREIEEPEMPKENEIQETPQSTPAPTVNEPETRTQEAPVTPAAPAAQVDPEAIRSEERERGKMIRTICKEHSISSEMIESFVESSKTIDEVRASVLEEVAKRNNQTKTNNHLSEVSLVDQRQLRIQAATNALLHRALGDQKIKLDDGAREFRGMSLLRLAEDILTAQGVNVRGMAPKEIATRALHSTSDFVEILANVTNKTLRDGYAENPQTFAPFTRRVTVNDFKEISRTQLGDGPILEQVNENGEYKKGTIGESAEKYRVKTYGKIVGVTRQTLINDDMNAFSRVPEMFGRRARDLEADLIYAELLSNPVMGDGNQLFSVAHGNIMTAAAIAVGSISEGRAKMRLQKGLNGSLLNIRPEHILVPATLETIAEQFTASIQPQQGSNVNPFAGRLTPIAEPRLDAASLKAWYLMASVGQIDMFELATLAGSEGGPSLETKMGFEVDGVEFKVSYDLGVKVIDWRGMVLNVGP